jgi:hypothetical protein
VVLSVCRFRYDRTMPQAQVAANRCGRPTGSWSASRWGNGPATGLGGKWPSFRVMVSSERSQVEPAPNIIEGTTMEHYAGIDVSLESASVCVVDAAGRIVREAKIASEPDALIGWLRGLGTELGRIGSRAAIAMAERGPAGGRACGGAVGDPACARGLQGDAGQDRPQGRSWHRTRHAVWNGFVRCIANHSLLRRHERC